MHGLAVEPFAVLFTGRSLNSVPLWEGLWGRITVHYRGRERFVGKITLNLRWKNFKKDYSFPTVSRWGRVALHLERDYTFEQTELIIFSMDDFLGQLGT